MSIFCSSISAPRSPADNPSAAADFPTPGSRFGRRAADRPRAEAAIPPESRRAREAEQRKPESLDCILI